MGWVGGYKLAKISDPGSLPTSLPPSQHLAFGFKVLTDRGGRKGGQLASPCDC